MLKKYSSNSLVAVLIIRLIAEISSNFKNFDFSIYHETFEYLLSKEILDSKISSSSSSSESALLKHYAHFIIYSYRTIKCQEINKIKNLDIDAIYRYFETMMHPEHSYKSPFLIYLSFYITKTLCIRLKKERQEIALNPTLANSPDYLAHEDIKCFISILKPSLELGMQGNIMLSYISATLK